MLSKKDFIVDRVNDWVELSEIIQLVSIHCLQLESKQWLIPGSLKIAIVIGLCPFASYFSLIKHEIVIFC